MAERPEIDPDGDRHRRTAELLDRWRTGEETARDELVEKVYDELRGLARAYLRRERRNHTLRATELVHEALLRLLGRPRSFNDRAHFFRAAAKAMRRILVDHARRRRAGTRIPPEDRLPLEVAEPGIGPGVDVLELHDVLTRLAEKDPEAVQVVELRCFVGLPIPEVAEVLGVSEATVSRHWRLAKGWLLRRLAERG